MASSCGQIASASTESVLSAEVQTKMNDTQNEPGEDHNIGSRHKKNKNKKKKKNKNKKKEGEAKSVPEVEIAP